MTDGWKPTSLADILTLERRPVKLDPEKEYSEIGIYSFGRGIFHKRPRTGFEVGEKDLYIIKKGDFIFQITFAWEGAVGLASELEDEMYGSVRFPTYRVNEEICYPKFLVNYFKTYDGRNQLVKISPGSAGRNRVLSTKRLPEILVPLPPLEEQHRIVERIEAVTASIAKVQSLRQEASKEAEALLASVRYRACIGDLSVDWRAQNQNVRSTTEMLEYIKSHSWDGHATSRKRSPMSSPIPPQIPEKWQTITFGELQEIGAILDIQDGNHGGDYPRQNEFSDDGIPFVTAKQMSETSVDIQNAPRLPKERAERLRIGFAKGGDVLISHNASVGKVVRAPIDAGDFLLGTSATYYRCNPQAINPDYLVHFMKSDLFQNQLQWIMKQTTRNQVSVLKQVNLWICLPPLEEQSYLTSYLNNVQARLVPLRQLQAETQEELDALLPSVLDRAFKGEL